MNFHLVKNKYLNALLLLVIFSAIVHMGSLFIVAIIRGSISPLNFFSIVRLNYFFPQLTGSWSADLISVAVAFLLYLFFLVISDVHRKND